MAEPEHTKKGAAPNLQAEPASARQAGDAEATRAKPRRSGDPHADDTVAGVVAGAVAGATGVDSRGLGTAGVALVETTVVQTMTSDDLAGGAPSGADLSIDDGSDISHRTAEATGIGSADGDLQEGAGPVVGARAAAGPPPGDEAWRAFDERVDDLWPVATAEGAAVVPSTHDFERIGGGGGGGGGGAPLAEDTRVRGRGSARPPAMVLARLIPARPEGAPAVAFEVRAGDNSIGRSKDNDIVIDDVSVSRRHARLLASADRYVITDERSANGLFVNGARVDRARLMNGDELSVGNVALRFVELADPLAAAVQQAAPRLPGQVPRRAAAGPRASVAVAARIAIAVALASALLALALYGWRQHTQQVASSESLPLKEQYLNEGVDLFKARQWEQAQQRFTMLLHLDPRHPRAHYYLDAIAVETAAHQRLISARAAFADDQIGRAERLAKGLLDSSYRDEASALRVDIEMALARHFDAARAALATGDPRQAQVHLQRILEARPDWPGAESLRGQVDRDLAAAHSRTESQPRESAGVVAPTDHLRAGGLGPPGPQEPKWTPANADELAVLQSLAAGDLDSAAKAVAQLDDAVRGRQLARRVADLSRAYDAAMRSYRAKRAQAAIELLGEVRRQALGLVGADSPFVQRLSANLADMHYVRGIEAQLAGDLSAALGAFTESLRWAPGHGASAGKRREMAESAATIFADAVAAASQDPARARRLFELITRLLPSDHPMAQQARDRLAALR